VQRRFLPAELQSAATVTGMAARKPQYIWHLLSESTCVLMDMVCVCVLFIVQLVCLCISNMRAAKVTIII